MARLMQINRIHKFYLPTTFLRQVYRYSLTGQPKPAFNSILPGNTDTSFLKSDAKKYANQVTSLCRQNFHAECEEALNKQINLELYGSYIYLSMAYHFDRQDVALKGFYDYFKNHSDEERIHAEQLMKLQNQRGGRLVLQDLKKPEKDDWGTGLQAMEAALELEKIVNQSLLDLHKIADKHGDAHLTDFIEETYLMEQVETIKTMSDFVSILERNGPGLGEYLFDVNTLQKLTK